MHALNDLGEHLGWHRWLMALLGALPDPPVADELAPAHPTPEPPPPPPAAAPPPRPGGPNPGRSRPARPATARPHRPEGAGRRGRTMPAGGPPTPAPAARSPQRRGAAGRAGAAGSHQADRLAPRRQDGCAHPPGPALATRHLPPSLRRPRVPG